MMTKTSPKGIGNVSQQRQECAAPPIGSCRPPPSLSSSLPPYYDDAKGAEKSTLRHALPPSVIPSQPTPTSRVRLPKGAFGGVTGPDRWPNRNYSCWRGKDLAYFVLHLSPLDDPFIFRSCSAIVMLVVGLKSSILGIVNLEFTACSI